MRVIIVRIMLHVGFKMEEEYKIIPDLFTRAQNLSQALQVAKKLSTNIS